MQRKGFDSEKYIEEQSKYILERINQGDSARLYLEFGGKLVHDKHAMRVLPGFDENAKIKLLERLKDQASVKIVPDIRKNSCLGNHHKACQTENNKAFKIFSSFHQNTSYSTINYDIYYFFFLTLLL